MLRHPPPRAVPSQRLSRSEFDARPTDFCGSAHGNDSGSVCVSVCIRPQPQDSAVFVRCSASKTHCRAMNSGNSSSLHSSSSHSHAPSFLLAGATPAAAVSCQQPTTSGASHVSCVPPCVYPVSHPYSGFSSLPHRFRRELHLRLQQLKQQQQLQLLQQKQQQQQQQQASAVDSHTSAFTEPDASFASGLDAAAPTWYLHDLVNGPATNAPSSSNATALASSARAPGTTTASTASMSSAADGSGHAAGHAAGYAAITGRAHHSHKRSGSGVGATSAAFGGNTDTVYSAAGDDSSFTGQRAVLTFRQQLKMDIASRGSAVERLFAQLGVDVDGAGDRPEAISRLLEMQPDFGHASAEAMDKMHLITALRQAQCSY
ncbi:hypothetical protein BC831DRAFT_455396 [Entophlyctis helioformis]|nr:hypothetical protein BC831DRAFT_455396 [Entophlyctis helioformis]